MNRKEELRKNGIERRRKTIVENLDNFCIEAQELSLLNEDERGNKNYSFSSRCGEFRVRLETSLELGDIDKKEFRNFSNILSRCAILAGLSIHHKKENETGFSIFTTIEEFDECYKVL